jgi:hypothetical protein
MEATYNITNNRLFFWPNKGERLPEDKYKEAKSCGFVWWPRGCFTAIWSPWAEDFIKSYGLTITDDDQPDNVEARVERFEKYAADDEKTAQYAEQRLETGAAHTNRQVRQAEGTAQSKTDEAQYWHRRIAGAISHAEYHDRPDVIARRIKGIEADLRKHTKEHGEGAALEALWKKTHMDKERAAKLANYSSIYGKFPQSAYAGDQSLWGVLDKGELTAEEAQAFALAHYERVLTHESRWIDHLNMRLEYERAYLAAAGGLPSDNIDLQVGMIIGGREITKVNKTTVEVKTSYGHLKMDKQKLALTAQREAQEAAQQAQPEEPTPTAQTIEPEPMAQPTPPAFTILADIPESAIDPLSGFASRLADGSPCNAWTVTVSGTVWDVYTEPAYPHKVIRMVPA